MKRNKKLRVVVDTNILVSALFFPHSVPHKLFELWESNKFILLVSDLLLAEYENVLQRSKFSKYKVNKKDGIYHVSNIKKYSVRIEIREINKIAIRDAKDEMILDTAIAGNAEYIVTGDKDLLVLDGDKKLGKLRIVTVKEFVENIV